MDKESQERADLELQIRLYNILGLLNNSEVEQSNFFSFSINMCETSHIVKQKTSLGSSFLAMDAD